VLVAAHRLALEHGIFERAALDQILIFIC